MRTILTSVIRVVDQPRRGVYEDGPPELQDDRRVRLGQVALREGDRFISLYDFGDGWEHELTVEQILPPDASMMHPVCLDGARAGPPGYERFLEAIRDPEHPEHEDLPAWIGGAFDPEAFDPTEINRRLRALR